MIVTRQMVREADLPNLIKLLREDATWHDEEGAHWLLLTRAADELERLTKGKRK